MNTLTSDERRITCFHEAAHAVVFAIGGAIVDSVEVAPLGATNWETNAENGAAISDLWGVCRGGDRGDAGMFIHWSDDAGYQVDVRGHRAWRRKHDNQRQRSVIYRHLRRYICGVLAGPVSELIYNGFSMEGILIDACEDSIDPAYDLTIATAHSRLLPFRNEFDNLASATVRLLSEPETWQRVSRLAEYLEAAGEIEGEKLQSYLPDARPK